MFINQSTTGYSSDARTLTSKLGGTQLDLTEKDIEAETRKYNLLELAALATNCHGRDVGQFCSWWLENNRAQWPFPHFMDLPGEASIWAAAATPAELEEYHRAILNEINCTAFHTNSQKRIVVRFWSQWSDSDKAGFLRKFGDNA